MTTDPHSASLSGSWLRALGLIVIFFLWLAPLVAVLVQVIDSAIPREAFDSRWLHLLGNTLLLALGACMLAVPIGTLTGMALARCRIAGRGLIQLLLLIGLLMPLPVTVIAWQTLLGGWVEFAAIMPGDVQWRSFQQGMLPSMLIHGMAALPWVVLIVTATLRSVDLNLEDQARLDGNQLVRRVWAPRLKLAIGLSIGWILTQVVTEITVTDAMMVRTLAEEVYTQFVSAGEGLPTVMALSLPLWGVALLLTGLLIRGGIIPTSSATRIRFHANAVPLSTAWTIHLTMLSWLAATLVGLLPLAAIVWKAGGGTDWGFQTLIQQCSKVVQTDGRILLESFATSLFLGTVIAWLACWLLHVAGQRRRLSIVILATALLVVVTPAPVLGLGLKQAIATVMDVEDWLLQLLHVKATHPPLRTWLYDQPSPLPAAWLCIIRFLPVALALQWPAAALIPTSLRETARLDGLNPAQTWRIVDWPHLRSGFIIAAIIVTALSLGEVGGSKLVNPPSHYTYILWLFDQMHYRSDSTVAALALMQVVPLTFLVGALQWRLDKTT